MRRLFPGALLFLVLTAIPCSAQSTSLKDGGFEGADAQAFNEMVFGSKGRSLRWAQAPELVLLMSVMQYQPGESNTYAATSEPLTGAEATQLADDLTTALGVLTGGAFTGFADVRREFVEAGATINVLAGNHRRGSISRAQGCRSDSRPWRPDGERQRRHHLGRDDARR